jgi:alanine-synthesizing transaminase
MGPVVNSRRARHVAMFADRTNWNLDENRLTTALARHRASGKPLLDLTASNPTESGFEYDQAAIVRALSDPAVLEYHPDPHGLVAARRAIAGYYFSLGSTVAVEDIFLTTSTSEAYSFIFRLLCNPGDELLIPAPSYPLFDFLGDIHDVRLVRYPLVYDHGWQVDFHALEREITPRVRGIVLVHPNNPTGHFCKAEDASRLNEICSERQLALIADEVFLDFVIGKEKPASFAANSGALTFTVSGLSKISGLPQMKAAWLIVAGPDERKQQALERLEVIADAYLSMNTPVQLAIPEFLQQRHKFQKQLLNRVRMNLSELDRQLNSQTHCTRLEVEGGWNAVLRVPATRSDEDLAIELLTARDVHVHPGHFYDFASEGYLVLSLITRETEFAEGVKRLLSMF